MLGAEEGGEACSSSALWQKKPFLDVELLAVGSRHLPAASG